MSLAKAVVTGTVYRTAEKRFTQNNVGVSAFVIDAGDRGDEMLMRVISKRQNLDDMVSSLAKGEKVLVEGRLQTAMVKTDTGAERRILEIDANAIERFSSESGSAAQSTSSNYGTQEDIVKFESDEISGNELIGEDEIPF